MSYWRSKQVEIEDFVGLTFTKVDADGTFYTAEKKYDMYHSQDCCERVVLDETVGNINDITDEVITDAFTTDDGAEDDDRSYEYVEYTNFHVVSAKGTVVFRWIGSGNGYYGTGVSISVQDNPALFD